MHVAVDDATHLAYAEVLPTEQGLAAVAFLKRTVAWFASLSITVERVLPGNGSCYRSAARHRLPRAQDPPPLHAVLSPTHQRRIERFIQTLTRRWAYGAIYSSSAERSAPLSG